MQSAELSDVPWRLDAHDRELRYLREDLTYERRARLASENDASFQRIQALRREIQGWRREPKPSRTKATRHEPVASSERNRRDERPIRRLLRGRIRGMEIGDLMSRNTEAFERFRESMDGHAEAADRHAEAAKGQTVAAKEQAEAAKRLEKVAQEQIEVAKEQARAFHNQSDVMRALVVDLKNHGDQLERDRKALTGSFADLAAEIRSWREER